MQCQNINLLLSIQLSDAKNNHLEGKKCGRITHVFHHVYLLLKEAAVTWLQNFTAVSGPVPIDLADLIQLAFKVGSLTLMWTHVNYYIITMCATHWLLVPLQPRGSPPRLWRPCPPGRRAATLGTGRPRTGVIHKPGAGPWRMPQRSPIPSLRPEL